MGFALLVAATLTDAVVRADQFLTLNIARSGTNLLITWTNAGPALESALSVTGPWQEVSNAASPYRVQLTNFTSFFRLRQTLLPPSFRYVAPTFSTSIGDPAGCGCTTPENPNSLAQAGNPQDNGMGSVLLHTGEVTQHAVDLEIPGRGFNWRFERRYRSGMGYDGPLGYGWDFSHNRRLFVETNGNVLCMDGLGRADLYVLNTNGTFTSPSGFYTRLKKNLDGTFEERDRHGLTNSYSAANGLGIAQLTRISDRNGNQMSFQYNALGQLTSVLDTLARSIAYRYDANGRLTNVTDFTGRALRYTYDTNGDLISVTSPAVTGTPNGNDFLSGKTISYSYASGFADARLNHNLLTVTAPNEVAVGGPPRLVAQYNTNSASPNVDRLISLRLGGTNTTGVGAGGTIYYTYATLGPAGSNDFVSPIFQNTVTNRNGNVAEYRFNQLGNIVRTIQFTRGLRAGDPPGYTNLLAFNKDGEMIGRTNAELDSLQYTYDSANPDRFQQGNLLQVLRVPGPRGGDQPQILTSRTYETNFNFEATSTDGRGNVTIYRYDARGNRTNIVHRIPSIIEDFEYNAFGQITAHVLPANGSGHRRRDAMTYYATGPQTGYLQSQVVDSGSFNLTTAYGYDAVGNVVRTVDPRGNDSTNVVNALNQVVRQLSCAVATPTNGLVRYQTDTFYDPNDNIVRIDVQNRDDSGVVVSSNPAFTTTYAFDILNDSLNVGQEVDASHNLTNAYSYDANQNLRLVRFGEATAGRQTNNVVQRLFDERDLLFKEIRSAGSSDQSTTQSDYDRNRNLTRAAQGTEDAGGHVMLFAYDGYDRRATATDPMGNVATYRYDPNGNVITNRVDGELTDLPGSAGNTNLSQTTYTYDAMDRRIRTDVAFFDTQTHTNIGDGLATMQTIYALNSQVVAVIDDNNHGRTNAYDGANRLSLVTDARGNTVAYGYDSSGNAVVITETDQSDLGNPVETFTNLFVYDQLNRITQSTDNLGNIRQYAYDSRGNRLLYTDPRTNQTRYDYDGLSRLIRTSRDMNANGVFTDVADIITTQTWDDSSRLTSLTDDNTNATRYAYDSLDRVIVTQMADGTLDQVGTGATWPLSNSLPNLGSFASGYDVHNNPIVRLDANGTRLDSTCDLNNRVLTNRITRAAGILGTTNETYQYDGLGRFTRAQDDDSIVTRAYDSLSSVTTETQQLPPNPARTVQANYDGVRNQTSLTYPGGRVVQRTFDPLDRPSLVGDASGPGIATYAYIGQRLERRDTTNDASAGVTTRFELTYDGLRRVTRTLHTRLNDGQILDDRTSTWDANDNRLSETNNTLTPPDTRSYVYDADNRLVRSSGSPYWPFITYNLDGVGNRTSVIGGAEAGSYFMNATLPEPADTQMNQYTTTPFDSRQYDRDGDLTGTTGQAAGASRQIAYDYRRQIASALDTATGQTTTYRYDAFGRRVEKNVGGIISRFYYDGPEEIEDQSGANSTVATYVHSKGAASLLQLTRSGQPYYLHEDDLGSIVKVTDNTGNVVDQTEYGNYGEPYTPGGLQSGDLEVIYDSDLDPDPVGFAENAADDFSFPASIQVNGLVWRGGYDYTTNIPSADFFVIRVYTSDSSNALPGTLIYENYLSSSQVTRTNTGRTVCCATIGQTAEYEYQLTLFSPISLQGNTRYWLSIVNNTSGTDSTWGWETSHDGNGRAAFRTNSVAPWYVSSTDFAFQLVAGQTNSGNPFLFAGMRYDHETRWYLSGDRYLDPAAGRFNARDQAGLWATAASLGNPYTFLGNNPGGRFVGARLISPQEGPPPPLPIEILPLELTGGAQTNHEYLDPRDYPGWTGPPSYPLVPCHGDCAGDCSKAGKGEKHADLPCDQLGERNTQNLIASACVDAKNDAEKQAQMACKDQGGDDCRCKGKVAASGVHGFAYDDSTRKNARRQHPCTALCIAWFEGQCEKK